MAKMSTDDLIEAFKELSLIELSEFVKKFEEVFEVTAAAPVAVAAAPAAAGGGEAAAAEEKDSFDVVLEAAGDRSSKRCVLSPTSAWVKQRPSLTVLPALCSKVPTKRPLTRPRSRSKLPAVPSPSSSFRYSPNGPAQCAGPLLLAHDT
jgi:hypothetical protein